MRLRRPAARTARLLAAFGLGGALMATQVGGATAVGSMTDPAAPGLRSAFDPDRTCPPSVLYRGLPRDGLPCNYNYFTDLFSPAQWTGLQQAGTSTAVKAQQSFRLPPVLLAAIAPAQFLEPPEGVNGRVAVPTSAYVISPDGAKHRYGDFPEFTVKTVAFGSIPAEVTVRLSQPRNESDLPVGINLTVRSDYLPTGSNAFGAVAGNADLNLQIAEATVDGRRLDLGQGCSTQTHLTVAAADNPAHDAADYDPATNFEPFTGGTVEARLDIPSFSGCRTGAGEDLSPLFTGLVSSDDNPVELKLSGLSNLCFPQPDVDQCPKPPPVAALPSGETQTRSR